MMKKERVIIMAIILILTMIFTEFSYGESEEALLKKATPHAIKLLTRNEALKFIFGDAKFTEKKVNLDANTREDIERRMKLKFNSKYDNEFDFFIGKKNGSNFRYAVIFDVPGKWGPIRMVMGITPKGKVYDLAIISYSEIRGKPAKKRIFLDQYKRKSIKSKLRIKRDIHAISGATITSRGITNGVKRMLFVFNSAFL